MDDGLVRDCPECRGVGTVVLGVCEVCFAEFDEWHALQVAATDDAADG